MHLAAKSDMSNCLSSLYPVFQDEEFRTMIRAGERMEFWYGHWFDCTVVNEDVDQAFEEVFFGLSIFNFNSGSLFLLISEPLTRCPLSESLS